MFFDDRLATVLRQKAQSDAMRRTQYRQLLDLLGAQASGARRAARDPSLVAAAWMRMNKLAETIPAKDRARLISEPGWRLRNPELVAHLADFEPVVASAALSRAQLASEDWIALVPRLPVRARGFMRLQRNLPDDVENMLEQLGVHDRGLPNPEREPQETAERDDPIEFAARPLDLTSNDELPGSNIPFDELPSEPLISPPNVPLEEGHEESESEQAPGRLRPIFFPKDKSEQDDRAQEPSNAEGQQDFTPEPFTIEELRNIAEEPLGIEEQSEEDRADAEGEPGAQLEPESGLEPDSGLEQAESAGELGNFEGPENTDPIGEPSQAADGRSEISALVERISNFQRSREAGARPEEDFGTGPQEGNRLMPRLPLGEEDENRVRIVSGFGFAADAGGRIEWAEDEIAPMVVGTRLIAQSRLRSADYQSPLTHAFNQRQPIKAAPFNLTGAPAIAGDWIVDAQPRFSQIGGFAGYVGRMRRPLEQAQAGPDPAQREADRIRQLLHELRTPVTAVQGYSEVIQQQLFGSAPHEYRALAAAIASDAARILSGFEELDRLAKLETGIIEIDDGHTDIASLAIRFVRQLGQVLDARMAGIELSWESDASLFAAIDPESAESLMWRLLASIGGACAASETLSANFDIDEDVIRFTCDLPMQLLGEDDLFAADARPPSTAINPGIFGAGFALRLARAEARTRGGDLVRQQEAIVLTLPKASKKQLDSGSELAAH